MVAGAPGDAAEPGARPCIGDAPRVGRRLAALRVII